MARWPRCGRPAEDVVDKTLDRWTLMSARSESSSAPRRSGSTRRGGARPSWSSRPSWPIRRACSTWPRPTMHLGSPVACSRHVGSVQGLLAGRHARAVRQPASSGSASAPTPSPLVGTLGVCAGALVFFPQGELLAGVLVITAFVFSDLIDGAWRAPVGQLVAVRRLPRLHARPDRRRARSSAAWRSTSPARATATSTSCLSSDLPGRWAR